MIKQIIRIFKEQFNKKNEEENIDLTEQLEKLKIALEHISEGNNGRVNTNRKNASKTLKISAKQKEKLEKLAKGRCVALHLKQRAKIILELTRTSNMSSVA